ncbi:TIP41-like protein [Trichinella pseudospiralis]
MDDEDSPIPGDPFDSSDDDDIEAGSGGKVLLKSHHENKHKTRELANDVGGQLQTWSRLTYLCLSSFILGCMVSIIGPTVPILLRQNNGPSFSMGFSVVTASAAGSLAGILSGMYCLTVSAVMLVTPVSIMLCGFIAVVLPQCDHWLNCIFLFFAQGFFLGIIDRGRFSLFLEDWNKQFRLIGLIYMCFSVGGAVPLLIYALNVSESPSTATDFTTNAITKRSLSNDSSLGNETFGNVVNESVASWTSVSSPAPVKPKFVDSAGLKTDETYAARKEKELKHIELNAKAKEKMQTPSMVTEPANRTSEFNSTINDIKLPKENVDRMLLNNTETTTIATVTTVLSTLTTLTTTTPTTSPSYVSTLTSDDVTSAASLSETTLMSTVLPDKVKSVRDVVVKIVENDRLELAYHTAAGMAFFVLAILMAVYCASCRMCSGSGVGRPQMMVISCENAGSVYQLKTLTVGLLFVLFIAGVEWTLATITVSYLLVEHQRSLSDSVALCALCWCLSCFSRLVSLCCSFSRHLLGVCLVVSALLSGALALSRSYSAVAVLLCAYATSVGPLLPATFHWFNQQAGLPAPLVTVWLLAINLSRALVPLAVGALVEIGMRNFQTTLLFMTSLSLLLFIPLEKWTKQSKHYSDALSVSMSRRGGHNFFSRRDHYTSFKASRRTADRLSTNENNNSDDDDDDLTDDDEILHFYKPHSKSHLWFCRLAIIALLLFRLTMLYRVTVKTLDGHDRAFELDPETTVGQFQERIAAEMNVPVERQRVIFHGRVLDPQSTVKDLDLNEKVIHLVEKMDGPPPPPASTTSTSTTNAQQSSGSDSASNPTHPHIFLGTVALPPNNLTSEQIYTIIREVLDEFGFSGEAATIQLQEPRGNQPGEVLITMNTEMSGPQPTITFQRMRAIREMLSVARALVEEGSDDVAEIVRYARRMQEEQHSLSSTGANDKESDASYSAEVQKEGEESAMDDSEEKPPESTEPVDQSTQTDANASSSTSNARRPRNATFQDLASLFSFLSATVRDLLTLLQNCELLLEAERHFEPFTTRANRFVMSIQTLLSVLHLVGHAAHGISEFDLDLDEPSPRSLFPVLNNAQNISTTPQLAQIRVMIHQQNSNADARAQGSTDSIENQNNADNAGRTLPRRDDSSALRRAEGNFHSSGLAEHWSRDLTNMIHSVNEATGSMMDFVTIMNRSTRHSSDNHLGNYLRVRHGNTLTRHPSERQRSINRFYGQVLNMAGNSTVNISLPSRSAFARIRQQRQQAGADATLTSSERSGGSSGAAPFRNFLVRYSSGGNSNTSASASGNAGASSSAGASGSAGSSGTAGASTSGRSGGGRELRRLLQQMRNTFVDVDNHPDPFLPCASRFFSGIERQFGSRVPEGASIHVNTSNNSQASNAASTSRSATNANATSTSSTATDSTATFDRNSPAAREIRSTIEQLASAILDTMNEMQPFEREVFDDILPVHIAPTVSISRAASRTSVPPSHLVGNDSSDRRTDQSEHSIARDSTDSDEQQQSQQQEQSARSRLSLDTIISSFIAHVSPQTSGQTLSAMFPLLGDEDSSPQRILNSLYRLLANSLVAGDVVDILRGNYATLDRFRSIMRRYFIENLLNGNERPSQEDMRQAAHRAAESEIPYCRRLSELLPEQNEIDLLSSLVSCEEDTVYRLLLLCFGKDSNEAFGQRLYKNLLLGIKQTLAVVVYAYSPNGEVDERIVRIMTNATLRDAPESVRRAFDSFGAGVLQTILAETLLPKEEVSGFFVKKQATTEHENRQGSAASESSNIITTAAAAAAAEVADAFAGEPMIVDSDSADSSFNNQPTELDLQQVALCNCTIEKDDEPSVRASINSLPPEVIASLPIGIEHLIEEDVQVQRVMPPQPPFSDIYLSSMPAKRRRVVQSSRLNLDEDQMQLFHDTLASAISSSESAESAPAVRNLLNSSEIVSEAVENFMRQKIQRRLRYDPDFTPVLFPFSRRVQVPRLDVHVHQWSVDSFFGLHLRTALKYPNRPDMVFHKNSLRVMHRGGASVHFDALAALDQVGQDAPESSCHVAASDVWRQARAMSEYLSNVLRTHDWTYSSMFIGDLVGFQVIATEEPLDLDRLRQPEPILFYAHIPLYEDELADHGCSKMELKLRCMPSGFLILLSHYLRVDGVLIRLLETRYRHLYGRTYVLRERTLKRSNFNQLTSAQLKMVMNPELLSANLSPMSVISERLHF